MWYLKYWGLLMAKQEMSFALKQLQCTEAFKTFGTEAVWDRSWMLWSPDFGSDVAIAALETLCTLRRHG
jgi:hypothetical protein